MPPSPQEPFEPDALMDLATAGDARAIETIFDLYRKSIYNQCLRKLSNTSDAEDAMQKTFVTFIEKKHNINNKWAIAGWLHGTANHVCREILRKRSRLIEMDPQNAIFKIMPSESPSADILIEHEELRVNIDEAISDLPDKLRTVYILCEVNKHTQAQVAKQLGLACSTINDRLNQAKGLLRGALAKRGIVAPLGAIAVVLGNAGTATVSASAPSVTSGAAQFAVMGSLVIVAIMIAVTGIAKARAFADRYTCKKNLQTVGLAIHNYESSHQTLPPQTRKAGAADERHGASFWWVITEYVEQEASYRAISAGTGGSTQDSTWWMGTSTDAFNHKRVIVHNLRPKIYRCPFSDLPETQDLVYGDATWQYQWGSYVCLSGSSNHSTTDRTTPQGAAHHSSGGVFPGITAIRIGDITDGTSNTIVIAEQSAYLKGNKENRTAVSNSGMTMGVKNPRLPLGDGTWGWGNDPNNDTRCFGNTTVRQVPNPPVTANWQKNGNCNTPLTSNHSGGIMVLLGDGSVSFITNSVNLLHFQNLVDKDDGSVISMP